MPKGNEESPKDLEEKILNNDLDCQKCNIGRTVIITQKHNLYECWSGKITAIEILNRELLYHIRFEASSGMVLIEFNEAGR